VGELVAGELLGDSSRLLEPFRFFRYTQGKLYPVSNSPFPWSRLRNSQEFLLRTLGHGCLSWCRVFLRHGHEKKPECRIINGLPRWRRNCCNIKLAIEIDSASIN